MFPEKFKKLIENFAQQQQAIQKIFTDAKLPVWKILLIDNKSPSNLIASLPTNVDFLILVDPTHLTPVIIIEMQRKLMKLLGTAFFKIIIPEDFERELNQLIKLGAPKVPCIKSELNKAMDSQDFFLKIADEKKVAESSTLASTTTQPASFFGLAHAITNNRTNAVTPVEAKNLAEVPTELRCLDKEQQASVLARWAKELGISTEVELCLQQLSAQNVKLGAPQ